MDSAIVVTFDCGFCQEDMPMSVFNLVETKWGSQEWICDHCLRSESQDIVHVLE